MSNGDSPTTGDLYDLIISKLTVVSATNLIEQIEQTIERGVVIQGNKDTSKNYRPMNPEEKLTIGIEYLIASFDVPFMYDESRKIIGCKEIVWRVDNLNKFESSQSIRSSIKFNEESHKDIDEDSSKDFIQIDLDEAKGVLKDLINIYDNLDFQFPRVT